MKSELVLGGRPEEEVIQDLITIIHIFLSWLYELQKYSKKIGGDFINDKDK